MGYANILFGIMIIAAVVIGSMFAISHYTTQSATVDTYGNAPTATNNGTTNMVVNGTATGTSAEGGLLLFVAVLGVLSIIAYYAFNRR